MFPTYSDAGDKYYREQRSVQVDTQPIIRAIIYNFDFGYKFT